jgi:hypothetical protein
MTLFQEADPIFGGFTKRLSKYLTTDFFDQQELHIMKNCTPINNSGFAVVYGIIVLFIASIAGVSLITISQKDNTSAIDQVKIRAAAVSAEAALVAVEKQFENQPLVVVDILNRFTAAGANTANKGWLLSTADNWTQETRIKLDPANTASPSYSARILSFDVASKVVQVEGYGYGGAGGRKKAIGLYQLSGLTQTSPVKRYAFYINGEAKMFDKPVKFTGNACFLGPFASNGTDSFVINGSFQALSTIETVLFQSKFIFNGPALFMGPTTLQAVMTFNGKAGFNKVVTLNSGPMQAKSDLYFNQSISGNSPSNVFNMNGHVAHGTTTSPISSSRITNGTIVQDGAAINVATAVSLDTTAQPPLRFDSTAIPSSYIKSVSGNVNATTINNLYNSSTLWKGYLVIKPAAYTSIERSSDVTTSTLKCNTIWIVESMMFSNNGWYDCAPNTMTVIYIRSNGQINGLGSGGYFRGYVYAKDNFNITYAWKAGNNCIGAFHHVSNTGKFQMNSCTGIWNLTYDDEVINKLIADGLLIPPGGAAANGGLALADLCIRPKIVSKFF